MVQEELVKTLSEELKVPFYACESSNIVCYGYQPKELALWIAFKGNKIYRYPNITKEQFQDLQSADSKGKWVNANLVKTKIQCEAYELS